MSEPTVEIRKFLRVLVSRLGPGLKAANRSAGTISTKTDFHDIVTVHDRATEESIRDAIFETFPTSFILGEEAGWSTVSGSSTVPGDEDLVWLVDPIDGTSNFASGLDMWCISIAAARGSDLIASVIHQPTMGKTWSADEFGAYLDEPGEETVTLRVDSATRPADGICVTQFPSARVADDIDTLVRWREAATEFRSMRRMGSTALDLCHVADGRAVASFNLGINSWDVAAGIHILQQAGGIYEAYDGSSPASPIWDGPNFVAAASPACTIPARKAIGL